MVVHIWDVTYIRMHMCVSLRWCVCVCVFVSLRVFLSLYVYIGVFVHIIRHFPSSTKPLKLASKTRPVTSTNRRIDHHSHMQNAFCFDARARGASRGASRGNRISKATKGGRSLRSVSTPPSRIIGVTWRVTLFHLKAFFHLSPSLTHLSFPCSPFFFNSYFFSITPVPFSLSFPSHIFALLKSTHAERRPLDALWNFFVRDTEICSL